VYTGKTEGSGKKEANGKQEKRHLLLLLQHLAKAPKREQTTRKLSELESGQWGFFFFQQIRGEAKNRS